MRRRPASSNVHRTLAFASTACLAIFMSALAAPAASQQQLGAFQGTITDQTHGVLPGVTVTVTNVDTGISRTTTTNEAGVYRVPSVDPGRYTVKAELQGFAARPRPISRFRSAPRSVSTSR